jgi:hydrogenase expression/formation protein HypE
MATAQRQIEFHSKQISMAHGAGGEASRQLVEGLFLPAFSNSLLNPLSDAATFLPPGGRLAITSDSYVVHPLKFPGGSIGELAINGTVNDLAVSGAKPLAISAAFILEAGLPAEVLRDEVRAMAAAAKRAGAPIATGDTKVVEHGRADGLYISTTGIGVVDPRVDLRPERVEIGDCVLLSGPIGNHGMAIMLARAELDIEADIRSDTRPLVDLVAALVTEVAGELKWMRDATRGGVATVLNELARDAQRMIRIEEEAIPIDDDVRGACELLGLDPLQVANEGQFVAIVSADAAPRAIAAFRRVSGGERACILGEIVDGPYVRVVARSAFGGSRVVDMLIGDPLPRIC